MKFSELQRLQRREGITVLSSDARIEQLEARLCTITKERDALRAKIEAMEKQEPVAECWLPVPEKHPTFDPVDLQLSDGSVLCGCVPQSDGDYWWEGPSGEVFIDPRYAPVTNWRLSAAPEARQ